MKSKIKFYRVLLNILFYIFYVLLASIAFSFVFPTILVIFGQEVLDPNNPIFDIIQIGIIVLVFIFTLIFRKYCYLPIMERHISKNFETKKQKEVEKKTSMKEKTPELDIKIGKEIK